MNQSEFNIEEIIETSIDTTGKTMSSLWINLLTAH